MKKYRPPSPNSVVLTIPSIGFKIKSFETDIKKCNWPPHAISTYTHRDHTTPHGTLAIVLREVKNKSKKRKDKKNANGIHQLNNSWTNHQGKKNTEEMAAIKSEWECEQRWRELIATPLTIGNHKNRQSTSNTRIHRDRPKERKS